VQELGNTEVNFEVVGIGLTDMFGLTRSREDELHPKPNGDFALHCKQAEHGRSRSIKMEKG
jgi:hypothetical protein